MRSWVLTIVILIAIIGLVGVQMRLLWIGVKLEMRQFEGDVKVALAKFQGDILENNELENQLGQDLVSAKINQINDTTTLNILRTDLQQRLIEKNIYTDFSIAVTDRSSLWILMQDEQVSLDEFRFDVFRVFLGSEIQQLTGMECYLHLHISQLFPYLLKQLYYLIVPSFLFLIAILICLILLFSMLQNLRKLNQIKNDFINNLTHELKTPVFSIGLTSKLLQKEPERVKEFANLIQKENTKLKQHIDKVLELASIEQGKKHFQFEKTNLYAFIQTVASSFTHRIEAQQGTLQLDFQAKDIIIPIDQHHFSNALLNILDNALKYNQNIPFITISVQQRKRHIIISIKDNGMGIPVEHQKNIFDKFYRTPKGNQHDIRGFGLGLSYVKQVIKAHQGHITVESAVGVGTTFFIQLPIPLTSRYNN